MFRYFLICSNIYYIQRYQIFPILGQVIPVTGLSPFPQRFPTPPFLCAAVRPLTPPPTTTTSKESSDLEA